MTPRKQEPHEKTYLTTPIGRLVEALSYSQLLTFVVVVLLLSATYYWWIPGGNGLLSGAGGKPPTDFSDCLYFSVVTFTTVGYGDVTPVGFGRIVAGLVAFSGLVSVALLIGKVASERQYSMLLLLHTSDCQRRISGFAQEVQGVSSKLDEALGSSSRERLNVDSKRAMSLVNAVRNYVIFHLHQSRLGDFGNHSSLGFLCAELKVLQEVCVKVFKSPSADYVACQRSIVLVESLEKLVNTITNHWRENGSRAIGTRASDGGLFPGLKQMKVEVELLKVWRTSHVTEWSLRRVLDASPRAPLAKWPIHHHKEVAARIGFSKKLTRKCIDVLVQRKRLKIH